MDVSLLFHDTATNALSEALRGSIKLTMLSQHPNTRLYTFTQDIDGHQDVHRDQGNQEHIDIPKTKKVALAYMSTDQNGNNYAVSLPYGIDMDNGGFTTANQSYFQLLEAETIVTLHIFQKSIARTWNSTKSRTRLQGDSDIRASSG